MDIAIESVCKDTYDSIRKVLNTTGKLVCVGVMSNITFDSFFSKYVGQSPTSRVSISKATNFMDHATFYDFFDKVAINPISSIETYNRFSG